MAAALAVLLTAGVAWQRRAHGDARPLPYRLLDAGTVLLANPAARVTHKQHTLDLLLGRGRVTLPPGKEAILVSPGPRSSTGYDVRIVSVAEDRSRIVVTAREITPTRAALVRAHVSSPYRLLVVDRSPKDVIVRWAGR